MKNMTDKERMQNRMRDAGIAAGVVQLPCGSLTREDRMSNRCEDRHGES
jgi:hypothetical protein